MPSKAAEEPPPAEPEKTSRAGRNLPAAIGVGLPLLIVVLGGLLFYPPAFLAMVVLAAALGVWELSRALLQRGVAVPLLPIMVGVLAMPVSAYYVGTEGLLFALVACSLAVLVWRTLDPVPGAGQSIFAGTFILAWVPFLLSFSVLILREPNHLASVLELQSWPAGQGALQVSTMLLLTVASDTFGYLVGALFGKHPMAPKISPKKSWEGFAGSVLGALIIGVLAAIFLLDRPFWFGIVLAVAIVAAGTAGDLAESMVKRELGVKDMSSILPGHGGIMDRLDSILFAAPMAFLVFAALGLL
ncbi:phosphatidate cytidylyltransferase [Psychromicrobium lacuslunae]|uniref:Phosphatidate cytidylyltransferase n=1 Tax=Psychromicrobium lacuslunae TaxID=1618207 RepID=A0A0D4C2E2_9MICC|nr:phosphatidate cytidylyltransferase [Psychromicrobium lacuslunae]AJT42773.1 phosphatidate cytidylyltransferase [Psychromicrobium lacuslunae]